MNQASDPIRPDEPLGRLLSNDTVPPLSSGFADRVMAGTETRSAPLPRRRRLFGSGRRWPTARRVTVGVLAAGALATAAAATGVLNQLPIEIPSASEVWASISGADDDRETRTVSTERVEQVIETKRVEIVGPIDTPEELEEAFTRIEEVRENRIERRRTNVDKRIDTVIDRRRNRGLPVPDAEQEARLRTVLDDIQQRRDAQTSERLDRHRENLLERVENGEELTREDFFPNRGQGNQNRMMRDRMERLRSLPPAQRRAAIRRFVERYEARMAAEAAAAEEEAAAIEPDAQADESVGDSAQSDQAPE